MTRLYLDIETIPSQEPWVKEYIIDTIKPPGTIKKQESIDAWYKESFETAVEEALLKTSFDGAMCHVVAIGYAIDDGDAKCFFAPSHKLEAEIIRGFFDEVISIGRPVIVGHNVNAFDMRILRQRATLLGIQLPLCIPFSAKPWDYNPYDTMVQWDAKNSISLDKLARAMGVKGKDGVDGSMVYKLWKNKKHERLIEYCKSDVEIVRDIAKRMMA